MTEGIAIPTTYAGALALAIFTMLCWGSWANTQKFVGSRWRFELFYYDYSLGVMLCAAIAAFTFGTISADITFLDNLSIIRKKQIAWVLVGGGVFNLANLLLVGAISVAGMAVAFPIGIGLALVIGVIWSYILRPQANPFLLFGGAGLVGLAIIIAALAYAAMQQARERKAPPPAPVRGRAQAAAKGPSPMKGILLSLASGVLMGSFYPLVQMGRIDDIEMSPYAMGFVFAVAVLLTTLVFNVFFTNVPIQGEPVPMTHYFKGTVRQHMLGILGGMIWAAGTISNFAAASAPAEVQVGPAVSYALGQGATLISTLWGLFYWKEFAGASAKANRLIALTLVLFVIGLTLVSIAPLFVR